MKHQLHESDKKTIEQLKKKCCFDYEINDDFCTKISFYKETEIFGSTIRKNTDKDEILKLVSTFPKLKHLNIRKSRVNFLPEFTTRSLEFLDISCNNLQYFPTWILKQTHLKNLNLGANNIENIPDLSHIELETIKLHKNKIKIIPKVNPSCKCMNLYLNTEISDYSENMKQLINLETFTFGVSEIKHMPPILHWPKLKWLTITVTKISNIDDICKLKNLEGLQLAKNNIESLPEQIGTTNIKHLTLYSNKIKNIPDSFYKLKLNKLNLEKNPLICKNKLFEIYKNIEFFKV